jgi:hypothetical protein
MHPQVKSPLHMQMGSLVEHSLLVLMHSLVLRALAHMHSVVGLLLLEKLIQYS